MSGLCSTWEGQICGEFVDTYIRTIFPCMGHCSDVELAHAGLPH